ncbi:MAG: hypothetical protein K8I00_05085, partial [Candidatus Omnitrophica bacterium]|nr:hypothetical protein [Candidatus Omnitrophota bacterium]
MKRQIGILLVMFLGGFPSLGYCAQPQQITPVAALQQYTHPKLQMTVIQGEYQLPPGHWQIAGRDSLTGLRQVQWLVPENNKEVRGERFAQIQAEQVQGHINSFYWILEQHAIRFADYKITLDDFGGDQQAPVQLIKSINAELGLPNPKLSSLNAALDWLNTTTALYRVCVKYMDQAQFTYPDYGIVNEVKQKFKLTKIEDLTDTHFAELAGTPLGQRFTRVILKKRYKLNDMPLQAERLTTPSSIDALDEYQRQAFYRKLYDRMTGRQIDADEIQYFPIPGVELIRGQKDLPRSPLVVELYPLVDDGKHWVLFNNGVSERVAIDPQLVQQYGLTIAPLRQADAPPGETYHFAAQVTNGAPGPWTVTVRDDLSGEERLFDVSRETADIGDDKVFARWSQQRARLWQRELTVAPSTTYMTWLSRYPAIYENKAPKKLRSANRGNRRGRTTSVLNMLGGRAAIEETLQMIDLNVARTDRHQNEVLVPLNQIEGVTVKAHDYSAMLAGQSGGTLELANVVPHDRFFAYFAEPGALSGYLEEGVDFVHQFGGDAFGNRINYDLKERYYSRLGLDAAWVERFLKSGFVKEVALFTPDLFFIDGTDLTLIVKVPQLKLVSPLLGLVGVRGLQPGKVFEQTLTDGRSVYWAAAGQLLMVSTHPDEMRAVLALVQNKGKGSLGRSAEFRYMLTQLPVQDDTRVFTYFSDPFIRRMTGPEVKIAQFRRLQERARLEALTAGALLYLTDGHASPVTLNRLAELAYIAPESVYAGDSLQPNLVMRSADFGTAGNMTTILGMNLKDVYAEEAKAYKDYVENYSRFWRQFFDPIAIRYDKTPEAVSEINVFILPLIDSSIYTGARAVLNAFEEGQSLQHPVFSPEPVLAISANINEDTWVQVVKAFGFLKQYTSLDSSVFDEFGPAMHVVVEDADPVINLGSGDFLGLLGAGGTDVFRARESLWMPIAFMLFTRPTKIMFELKDEEKVRGYLRGVSSLRDFDTPRDWGRTMVEFTQVEDRDEWNCRIGLFGVLSLRYGIRVQDGHLVFSNVPWSQHYNIDFSKSTALNSAAVSMYPGG